MIQQSRVCFIGLKQAIMAKGAQGVSTSIHKSSDASGDTLVQRDSFVPVAGIVLGNPGSVNTVTVHAGSIVDNRPETNDLVEFSTDSGRYRSEEYRWVDSDGGVVQTQYQLHKLQGSEWVEVNSVG